MTFTRLTSETPEDFEAILTALRRDRLRNGVLLKYALAFPGHSQLVHLRRDDRTATLLRLDQKVSAYDVETYPEAEQIVFVVSDDPALTLSVCDAIARDMPCVFKLIGEADAEALSARFPLVRQRAYHSYSGIGPLTPNPDVTVETQVSRLPFALLAAQGHERNWVSRLVINAGAFAAVYRQGGQPVSACLAFAIDGPLFEIGGVYTLPEARGRGLARKTVATALAELCRRQRLARYQVEETNHASIRLAQSLGLRRYQVLTHYTAAATA